MMSEGPWALPDSMAWTWRGGTVAPSRKASRKAGMTASKDRAPRVCSVSMKRMESGSG